MTPPTPRRKRAAIFDLDGTLVDSMPLVVAMFADAVAPYRDRPSPEEVLSRLGGPLDACVRNLLGPAALGSFAEARERMLRYEHEHLLEMKPFDGALGMLESLAASGAALAIWTGRDRWSAEKILAGHGFARFFRATVCGDDLDSHKPDPAGLVRAVELLGSTSAESVFVGDADVDVMGGRAAGVHTIFVHHGRAAAAHVHSAADEVYREPGEAYASVLRHFTAG
jgi:HAD superfamily hydrolase (TIGR01509 family)